MKKFVPFYIIKSSGEKELFDFKKLSRSLSSAGASSKMINDIVDMIKKGKRFKTAIEVYRFAHSYLKKYSKRVAGRYNLKKALRELGPTGFPFEQFVAQLFIAQGFSVKVGQIAVGKCISHEIDVVAKKDDTQFMVECKFRNKPALKIDVKVPLYVKARFDDVTVGWKKSKKNNGNYHKAYVFTNTKFTRNSVDYAKCVGIELVGWAYPAKDNVAQLIEKTKMYPITVLSTLTKHQKRLLVEKDVVLCNELCKKENLLKKLKFKSEKIDKIIEEAKAVCGK